MKRTGVGIGAAALSSLLGEGRAAAKAEEGLHHPAKAKRVIFLFQSGDHRRWTCGITNPTL